MTNTPDRPSDVEPLRSWTGRWIIALLVVGTAAVVAIRWRHELPGLVSGLNQHHWGLFIAIALFVPAVLVTAPVSWLTVLMGYVFGFARGALIGSCGGLIGATAAFGVSRFLLRNEVRHWWSRHRLFQALERELGSRGVRLIILARISPVVSCSLLSYLCGATRLSWGRFWAATWLGMAPGSIVYAWIGSSSRDWTSADASVASHPYARALWIAGLIATVGILMQLSRAARRMLDQQLTADT